MFPLTLWICLSKYCTWPPLCPCYVTSAESALRESLFSVGLLSNKALLGAVLLTLAALGWAYGVPGAPVKTIAAALLVLHAVLDLPAGRPVFAMAIDAVLLCATAGIGNELYGPLVGAVAYLMAAAVLLLPRRQVFFPVAATGAGAALRTAYARLQADGLVVQGAQPLLEDDAAKGEAGADIVTIHADACVHPHRVLQALGAMANANDPKRGLLRGIALNPGTPLSVVEPLPVFHGSLPILGFRMGALAYLTDVSAIPQSTLQRLYGLDLLVLGALRQTPHPTHFCVEQALEVARQVRPRRTLLTHIAHDLKHADWEARLGELGGPGAAGTPETHLAYDGLTLEI